MFLLKKKLKNLCCKLERPTNTYFYFCILQQKKKKKKYFYNEIYYLSIYVIKTKQAIPDQINIIGYSNQVMW